MEEAKALAQQQLMLQRQQQQQQLLLLQQIQRQKHHHQQQQQQQQQDAIARFPSNIDVHLRPQHLLHHRPTILNTQQTQPQSQLQPQSQPKSHPQQQHQQSPNPSSNPSPSHPNPNQQNPNSNSQQQPLQQSQSQQQQQQKVNQPTPVSLVKQTELKMAYQDAWTVCHPDFKHPFSSLADACERLLPYHVVADYEAEEEDRILDSDTTGQMQSRSQQWDHNIAAKVAEFTATFEKQVLAFNIISRKRALGEFRSEERLMIEQALLQEERRALIEARAEMDSRQKAGREAHEANLRMAAMVHAEQARAESQSHAEMVARAPFRASALGSQGSSIPMGHDISDQELEVGPDEMINDWGSNAQRDEKEPSDDFLNDDETDNGDTGLQNEWRGGAELDLNTR